MSKGETRYLKFTETKRVQSSTDPATFEAGRIYGFKDAASYDRWVIRGAQAATADDFAAQLRADQDAKKAAEGKAKPTGAEGDGQQSA